MSANGFLKGKLAYWLIEGDGGDTPAPRRTDDDEDIPHVAWGRRYRYPPSPNWIFW